MTVPGVFITRESVDEQRQSIGGSLDVVCAADIQPESISWLWPYWLALGKLAILAGAPGTGKTTLALSIAAVITTAGRWPDKTPCHEIGSVLIWSGEDDPADTLVPRLIAAGADLYRAHFLRGVNEDGESRSFDPSKDIPLIAAALEAIGDVRLLIIDPIVSAVSGDSHKAAEVRRSLQPIVDYAMKHRCAVLGITHFAKGTSGGNPLERVIGSQAFGALARLVLVAAKDENSEADRVLARAKSNIGPDDGGVSYTLESVTLDGGIVTSRTRWGEIIAGSAREILGDVESTSEAGGNPVDDAAEFLREALANGSVTVKNLKIDADGSGHSWATVRRAKTKLGVISLREGYGEDGGWSWKLQNTIHAHQNTKGAHSKSVSMYGNGEHLCPADDDREGFSV
ncbi:MAG: AAA family ATPase [bacterium]|nr:AAA family ATPase [bacterium]